VTAEQINRYAAAFDAVAWSSAGQSFADVKLGIGAVLDEIAKDYVLIPVPKSQTRVQVGTCGHHCSAMRIQPDGNWLHIPSLGECADPPKTFRVVIDHD
jgi:hypothetical protein